MTRIPVDAPVGEQHRRCAERRAGRLPADHQVVVRLHRPGGREDERRAPHPVGLEVDRPPAAADRRHGHDRDRAEGQHRLAARRGRGDHQAEGRAGEHDARRGQQKRPRLGTERDAEGEPADQEEESHLHRAHRRARRELGDQQSGERHRHAPHALERAPLALVEEPERDPEQHAEEEEGHAEARHVLIEGVEAARRAGDARLLEHEWAGQAAGGWLGERGEVECGKSRRRGRRDGREHWRGTVGGDEARRHRIGVCARQLLERGRHARRLGRRREAVGEAPGSLAHGCEPLGEGLPPGGELGEEGAQRRQRRGETGARRGLPLRERRA